MEKMEKKRCVLTDEKGFGMVKKVVTPDLRGVRPSEPVVSVALDIAALVEQLQKSPKLRELLAKAITLKAHERL